MESVPKENVVPKGDVQGLLQKILSDELFCKTGWNIQSMTTKYVDLISKMGIQSVI